GGYLPRAVYRQPAADRRTRRRLGFVRRSASDAADSAPPAEARRGGPGGSYHASAAGVAELADAPGLGPGGRIGRAGSSPVARIRSRPRRGSEPEAADEFFEVFGLPGEVRGGGGGVRGPGRR